ncbi:MAG: amidohydrolase [Betaproteobacteria bacterium]|jgi:amidohydrolase|nr:amidohydrolase [Rhodocyclaceae bacterium]MCA3136256.1 amidohydrolase [Rhodocyclaceae bacterium]MCA3143878.1 amidohydrolase [Rhodocyclaceae bacterium]MCA3146642.1 amidohydrolase [Rhodocyclaceae bacterium]MCE2899215.1 amidohydrolase [Betaproteobacteria bacterium]
MRTFAAGLLALAALPAAAADLGTRLDSLADALEPKVIAWRRDIHQHPELGNREVRTAGLAAEHLKALGYEVLTGVARTGVVAVLRGGRPGPVVALRADMDALPVTEEVDLPFASKARTTFAGKETGVMHACGHDTHVAMLMGAAEAFAAVRDELPGTVLLLFQPSEEGPPPGEKGGATLMIEEGALDNPKPAVIFGLHIGSMLNVGQIGYRPGAAMAAADVLRITVKGRQTHGAAPWAGVDPIVVSAQIVLGLQTIVSRQVNITREPVVVTIGGIDGGIRFNIIPDKVTMVGTIRSFDEAVREDVHRRIRLTAENIAEAAGAVAEVEIEKPYAVTVNDPILTAAMLPTLKRVAGAQNVQERERVMGAEDFSFYGQKVPGLFLFLGGTPVGQDAAKAPSNHSPKFSIDESALKLGVRTLLHMTVDYMQAR